MIKYIKYIWIIMALIIYIIWGIASIRDFIHTAKIYRKEYIKFELEEYTEMFIFFNLLALFIYSMLMFYK